MKSSRNEKRKNENIFPVNDDNLGLVFSSLPSCEKLL